MTDEQKQFLDELRESGETNMYAAPQYLQWEFGLDKAEARLVFQEWAKSFEEAQNV